MLRYAATTEADRMFHLDYMTRLTLTVLVLIIIAFVTVRMVV